MADSPTKLQRWLDLIAYLVGRRLPVSADELMRAVPGYAQKWESESHTDRETARRMFERDKDELRRLGIPLRTMKYALASANEEQEGYVIERRDFYLPYLKIVEQATARPEYRDRFRPATVEVAREDAPLAAEALRRVADVPGFPMVKEARSAFRKLAFDMDPSAFAEESPIVLFAEKPGTAELTAHLRVLSEALLARKTVTFRYHGIYRGHETSRTVDGYGVLLQHGHWYFIGRDHDRDDIRVFRVGRMDDVTMNTRSPNRHDYTIPDDFQLSAYVGRQAWELGGPDEEPVRAQVHFPFPLSLWAERNDHGALVERLNDGSTVREFVVHQVNPFLRWLLSLQGEARLLTPPELIEEMRALAAGIASAHASSDDASSDADASEQEGGDAR